MAIEPVTLEVITPMLSTMEPGCFGCRVIMGDAGIRASHGQSCMDEFPEDWKHSGARLSAWIREISSLYRHRVRIRIIDALSPQGVWRQIRYRLHRLPAFVIDRKHTVTGWDQDRLESLIDQRIQELAHREYS